MTRLPRNELEPWTAHVWARGVEKRWIFGDDEDRQLYLRLLIGVARTLKWRVLAYCLMHNHIHLVIETTEPNLGKGIQLVHGRYAQLFNIKYGRVGHLFQERYGSRPLLDDVGLATVVAYVAANPVAAKLCDQPEDYPWSSYVATVRDEGHPLLDIPHLLTRLKPLGKSFAQIVEERLISGGLPAPG